MKSARKKRRLFAVVIMLAVCAPVAAPSAGHAQAQGGLRASGKVVVLLVDRIGVGDFPSEDTPFCSKLAEEWSVGLMVTRSSGRDTGKESDIGGEYVSLGAGLRAKGAPDSGLSFDSGEQLTGYGGRTTAGEFYRRHTGLKPPADGVVCLSWQQVKRNNSDSGYGDNPGLLGTLLSRSGRRAAVVGNTDGYRYPRRFAPLVCCVENGSVSLGDVGPRMVEPSREPGLLRTNMSRLLEESRLFLAGAELLVIDTGDTGRIDRESSFTSDEFLESERRAALRRVDELARRVCGLLDLDSSLLLIVSPGAPLEARKEGSFLTPCIAAGRGFNKGILSSASTRRPGVVNNSDFLPTVLGFFGISVPASVVGSSMETVKGKGSLDYLRKLSGQLGVTRKARWPVVLGYGLLAVLFLLMVGACMLSKSGRIRRPRRPENVARFTAPASCVLLSAPLSFLFASAFTYHSYLFPALFCPAFSLVVGLAAWLLQKKNARLDPVVSICLLTTGVLLVDLFRGGRLLLLPLLGASSLEGMRFFGFPNTFVGVLLGVSLFAAAGLMGPSAGARRLSTGEAPQESGRSKRLVLWTAFIALMALAFIIGFGALGANLGGFIAAMVTYLLFVFSASEKGLTRWRIFLVPFAAAAGTALVVLTDLLFFHSHAGKAVSGGVGRFWPIVGRKVAIHVGEIKVFLLPAVILMVAVVAAALWIKRPTPYWTAQWEQNRPRMAAVFSLLIGGVVALLFNDTGIAILAVMILIALLSLSYYHALDMSMRRKPHLLP